MKIDFWPEPLWPQPAPRAYERDSLDKIRLQYVPSASQHYVSVERLDDEECDGECNLHLECCFYAELVHPDDCECTEPGDGLKTCSVEWIFYEVGLDDVKQDIPGEGAYPVSLHVERYGSYWDPGEVDCYLILEEEDVA